MKKLILLLLSSILLVANACASGNTDSTLSTGSTTTKETTTGETMNITLTIGTKTFAATLSDNAATRALIAQFPLSVDMSELNGNEYYAYLDISLPAASKNPRTIHAGDIKLYGANCLVIFYKSFSTSYSYTDWGEVSDTAGLLDALKARGGKVVLSLAE